MLFFKKGEKMILAFGDLHLTKEPLRILSVLNFLDYVIKYCKDNNIKNVVNLGDLFDRPESNSNAFVPVFRKLMELSKVANIYSIIGNHELKDKDGNDVEVSLRYIGSSMKLGMIEGLRSNIKTLRKLKNKGKKVGRIKFRSDYRSIELKQYGVVYQITGRNRIKVQGIKKPLPVRGLDQLDKYGYSYDIANAKLIKRNGDYYINITIYYNDENKSENDYISNQIGIDFGCETSFTLSNGEKIDVFVEETDRIKNLQRRINRQQKGSNNRRRTILSLRREYDRISRIKDDKANKLVHKLLSENRQIIMQDEQIHSWKKKHGRKIQYSVLGRVKDKLVSHKKQVFVMNRFVPTTKLCYDCGHAYDIQLWDRKFVCPNCGVIYDRDVHAAMNMVWLYNNLKDKIGLGESEFKRVEFDEEVHRIFGEWDNQMLKHEDATSLA